MLDNTSAFDCMVVNMLLDKRKGFGLSSSLCHWLESYLQPSCAMQDSKGLSLPVTKGVIKGLVLRP